MDNRRPGIRPRPTFGRRLDIAARWSFPFAATVLLMLIAAAPLGVPGQAMLLPAVSLCCVYFWSVFRPASMIPPQVFVIGLLLDLLGYLPIGLGVLMLLTVHGLAAQSRRFLIRHGFALVWTVFAVIALAAGVLVWALSSLLTFRLLPIAPALFQAVLTMALYPALATLFALAHTTIADPERA